MAVIVSKLISGEEIIADLQVVEQDGVPFFELTKPAVVFTVEAETASGLGVALVPFMPYAKDGKITLHPSNVVTQVEPIEGLYNSYSQLCGSGIQVVTGASSIITG